MCLLLIYRKIFFFSVFQVLGGFDASSYVTERKWAVASDGTRVPISVLYRNNLVKLDGSDPLLLYGYGSYEVTSDAHYTYNNLRVQMLT